MTGGGGGIGDAACRRFAEEGAKVAVFDINQKAADATVAAIVAAKGQAKAFVCDITDYAGVQAAVAAVRAAFGPIDILVNNAGWDVFRPFLQTTPADWQKLIAMPGSDNDDRVMLAEALIRANRWGEAKAMLGTVPPTHETYDRYRLEAMVADSEKNWKKADSFYEIAAGMTTKPAGVLNNWGFSKLNRKDFAGAERLFVQALTYEPGLFTAKNNLVMARAAQRKYDLPVVEMSQKERAELLYTMALAAIKQGDVAVGKGLLQQAVDTSPTYFDAAARSLAALDANVKG